MAECRTNVPGGYCAVHGRGLQVGADGLCIVGREARSPDVVAFAAREAAAADRSEPPDVGGDPAEEHTYAWGALVNLRFRALDGVKGASDVDRTDVERWNAGIERVLRRCEPNERASPGRVMLAWCIHCACVTVEPRGDDCACGEELYPVTHTVRAGDRVLVRGGGFEVLSGKGSDGAHAAPPPSSAGGGDVPRMRRAAGAEANAVPPAPRTDGDLRAEEASEKASWGAAELSRRSVVDAAEIFLRAYDRTSDPARVTAALSPKTLEHLAGLRSAVHFARVCAQLAQVPKEVRDFIGRDIAETVDVPPSVADLLERLAEEWLRAAPPRSVDRDASWSLVGLLRRVWARGYGYGVCVEVESDRRASNAATLYEHAEARADAAEAKLRLVFSAAKDLEMDASRLSTNLHKLRG